MRSRPSFILAIVLCALAASCQKAPFLSIESPTEITFSAIGNEAQTITFTANQNWNISTSDGWSHVTPAAGAPSETPISVSLTCEKNDSPIPRSCLITIYCGDISSSITVSQEGRVEIESITLDSDHLNDTGYVVVREDETVTIQASITPPDASDQDIVWESSNPAVATVDNGVVTPLRIGSTRITARIGEISANRTVTVTGKTFSGLSLEALGDGEIVIANPLEIAYEYSKDQSVWSSDSGTEIRIPVSAGDVVSLRGNNRVCADLGPGGEIQYTHIDCTTDCYIYGNLISLIRSDIYDALSAQLIDDNSIPTVNLRRYSFPYLFAGNTHIKSHPDKALQIYFFSISNPWIFSYMFAGCTGLTEAPQFITRATASPGESCFEGMFEECTSLTSAPILPFESVFGYNCFAKMFLGCTSLKKAPELPATSLGPSCYSHMFYGCTNLTEAPKLPATVLADYCYWDMFSGCTSLKQSPALPATSLAPGCYSSMFSGCTSLLESPELPSKSLTESCYESMLYGCTSLSKANKIHARELADHCCYAMFNGCASLAAAPELLATELQSSCYERMFYGCRNLSYVKMMAIDINQYNGEIRHWLAYVAETGTFVKNSKATWDLYGSSGVPNGWTIRYEDE